MSFKKTMKGMFSKWPIRRRPTTNSSTRDEPPGEINDPSLRSDSINLSFEQLPQDSVTEADTLGASPSHSHARSSQTMPRLRAELLEERPKKKRLKRLSQMFSTVSKQRPTSSSYSEMVPESSRDPGESVEDTRREEHTESQTQSDVPGTSHSYDNTDIHSDSMLPSPRHSPLREETIIEVDEDDVSKIWKKKDTVFTRTSVINDTAAGDVWSFISNLKQQKVADINSVLTMLESEDLKNLHHEYGYSEHILYFCVLERHLRGGISLGVQPSLLESYSHVNDQRMKNIDLFNAIEEKCSEILSVKDRLSGILKEKISNCLVCLECHMSLVSVLFLPCGHMVLCAKCNRVRGDLCKCCNSKIVEYHQVYF